MKNFAALLIIGMLPMLGVNAQVKTDAVEKQAYVLTGTDVPNGATVQWYRNDVAIPGCTAPSCTVPAELCTGENVRFYRKVTVTSTDNATTVTFKGSTVSAAKCSDGNGTMIGDLCWANRNVDDYQTFAEKPDMYTKFYQWNSSTALAATGSVSGWSSNNNRGDTWTINPCPAGWRLPTKEEFEALNNAGGTWANANTWADANTRGNAVKGRFYGANHTTCALPNNMSGCVFLPTSGYRLDTNGKLDYQGAAGYYWNSTEVSASMGWSLYFHSTSSGTHRSNKGMGRSIRCVQ